VANVQEIDCHLKAPYTNRVQRAVCAGLDTADADETGSSSSNSVRDTVDAIAEVPADRTSSPFPSRRALPPAQPDGIYLVRWIAITPTSLLPDTLVEVRIGTLLGVQLLETDGMRRGAMRYRPRSAADQPTSSFIGSSATSSSKSKKPS
jgi:hypothetical protein